MTASCWSLEAAIALNPDEVASLPQTEEKKATSIGSGMQTESRKHSSSLTEAYNPRQKDSSFIEYYQ